MAIHNGRTYLGRPMSLRSNAELVIELGNALERNQTYPTVARLDGRNVIVDIGGYVEIHLRPSADQIDVSYRYNDHNPDKSPQWLALAEQRFDVTFTSVARSKFGIIEHL